MGERREVHDRTVGQRGERRELVPAQQTALVEEGRLGSGNDALSAAPRATWGGVGGSTFPLAMRRRRRSHCGR